MKKHFILAFALILGATASAQFTNSNVPAVGSSVDLYTLDSTASDYANETGATASWDYSSVGYNGPAGTTTTISVKDPASTSHASDFSSLSPTHAFDIQNFITNYRKESSTERLLEGFVFTDPTLGDVIATFEGDAEKTLTYPYNFGDAPITDVYSGTAATTSSTPIVGAVSGPLNGKSKVSVDGKGTLILSQNSYPNVIRYKIHDSAHATLNTMFGSIPITVKRTTYRYYDLSQGNMPIFMYITINVTSTNPIVTPTTYHVVLSKEKPASSTPPCATVANLDTTNVTDSSANISWTGAATDSFEYVLDQNSSDPISAGTAITGGTYSATSLSPNTTYYFHIRRDCGGGNFSDWTTISFTTDQSNNPCSDLSNVDVNNITKNSADITWVGTSSDNFEYVLDQSINAPTAAGTSISGGSYNASGLDSITTYYFHIRRDCGSGNYSNWTTVSFQTKGDTSSASISTNLLEKVKIYPNPVEGGEILNIAFPKSMGDATINILDGLGRSIMTTHITSSHKTMNIPNLNKGLYFMHISNGQISTVRRLIIK